MEKAAVLPKHLSMKARRYARALLKTYCFENHQVEVVISLAECLDRISDCRAAIKAKGAFFEDRLGNIKPHPALSEERSHRITFARLLRELSLSEEPEDPRPPGLKY
jgi:hypothetical protein